MARLAQSRPHSDHTLIQTICTNLFEAEKRRLDKVIVGLNKRHKELTRATVDGFLFDGRFYLPAGQSVTLSPLHRVLAAELRPEMEEHLRDVNQVELERSLIKQTFVQLLLPCESPQQRRDALPDCVIDYAPELARLPRRDRVAWSLCSKPRIAEQFERLLPKIELYAAARIFY